MLILQNEILQKFHRAGQVLQTEDMSLKTCTDLYRFLPDQLHILRDESERSEVLTKEILPDNDYNAA